MFLVSQLLPSNQYIKFDSFSFQASIKQRIFSLQLCWLGISAMYRDSALDLGLWSARQPITWLSSGLYRTPPGMWSGADVYTQM